VQVLLDSFLTVTPLESAPTISSPEATRLRARAYRQYVRRPSRKAISPVLHSAAMAGTALAQAEPPDDPLSVKPIASQVQTTKTRHDPIEDRTDGAIPTWWIWRATAPASGTPGPGREPKPSTVTVDKGRPHQAWTVTERKQDHRVARPQVCLAGARTLEGPRSEDHEARLSEPLRRRRSLQSRRIARDGHRAKFPSMGMNSRTFRQRDHSQ